MGSQPLKIAMSNKLHTGPYDPPLLNPKNKSCEWLIIRRWGASQQFLEISDTLLASGARGEIPGCKIPSQAPAVLTPNNSMLGLLVREDEKTKTAHFLLVRSNPTKQPISGTFYPVDGFAVLSFDEDNNWQLHASGRHKHDKCGDDVPHPAPGEGMSWHFDATQLPWPQAQT